MSAFGLAAAVAALAALECDPFYYDPSGSANHRRNPLTPKGNPKREKQKASKRARKITKRSRP